jgi:uncharacterized heparinase superfamily protein
MGTAKLQRWFHTLRYLRPIQVGNRVWRRLRPPRFESFPALPARWLRGRWCSPAERPAQMQAAGELQVFQQRYPVRNAADWEPSGAPHLVRYNLHYFDDLTAAGHSQRLDWHRDLMHRWVVDNRPGRGTGWEPYPTSLRIVNWVKWALSRIGVGERLREHEICQPTALEEELRASLATQAQALSEQLEYHLLANHLWANAKALIFAGVFLEGPQADQWLRVGSRIMDAQVREQILPDGGHFERSPLYHSLMLEDLLDLWNLANAYPDVRELGWVSSLPPTILAMRRWLLMMCHPDEQISFFNDAALGIAPSPRSLEVYAYCLGFSATPSFGPGVHALPDSGYIRLELNDWVVLIDVAEVGPAYQPGHAHADTLSFEASWRGHRLLVNSGTSCYGISPERHRQRSTAAHNTVVVDQQNSSDVWSGFRVGRRALPQGLRVVEKDGLLTVLCAHDGYRRLPGRVTHERTWRLGPKGLEVSDRLQGSFHEAEARFHLAPGVTAESEGMGERGRLTGPAGPLCWETRGTPLAIVASTYHPAFEVNQPSSCLVARFAGPEQSLRFYC